MFAFQRFVKLFEAPDSPSHLSSRIPLPMASPALAVNVALASLLSLIAGPVQAEWQRLGSQIEIGVGNGSFEFDVVGIAYHPLHIYLAPEGSLFPPRLGEYVIGYVSDLGMERLSGEQAGSANNLMLDIEGTPAFDLPTTDENEELTFQSI